MIWTCDPVQDAENYSAEQYERLERRPVCDFCGEHIWQEYYYQIDGKKICPGCLNDCREWID